MIDQSHIYSIIEGVKKGYRSVFNAAETITGYVISKVEEAEKDAYERGYNEGRRVGQNEGWEEAKQECRDSQTEK